MRFFAAVVALVATASFAAAQTVSLGLPRFGSFALTFLFRQLPACAATCYADSYSAAPSCSTTDLTCLCESTAFQDAVGACLETGCVRDVGSRCP